MDRGSAAQPANMRITLWGVQGSCPSFPSCTDIAEYAQRASTDAIAKTLAALADRAQRGALSASQLSSPALAQELSESQGRLGLPPLPLFGGETTCIEVTTADNDTLIFDMGSGLRDFSAQAQENWGDRPRKLHVFLSHEHLDHRNGLAFSSIFFDRERPFEVIVHGNRRSLAALDSRYGIFSRRLSESMHVDDPIDYQAFSATFRQVEIPSPCYSPIEIGQTRVSPFEVYHGSTPCLGYRVEHRRKSFVFCTDHELRHGQDDDPAAKRSVAAEIRLLAVCRGVHLAYFDGQYRRDEYDGKIGIGRHPAARRVDWGHSCIEDVVNRANDCEIRRALIGHHDPDRPWQQRIEIDRQLRSDMVSGICQVELARAGQTIEI